MSTIGTAWRENKLTISDAYTSRAFGKKRTLVAQSRFVTNALEVRESGIIFSSWHYPAVERAVFFGWDGDKAEIYAPDEGFPGCFTAAPRAVDEARAVFARRRSIADLVEAFDLRRRDLPKFLAGIDVSLDDEVCRNRAQGMSFADIAKLQKTGAAKIRRILKQRGFEIRPGNTLKNEPSDAELRRAKAAGKSVNRIAKEFGIHWKTAKRRLDALA